MLAVPRLQCSSLYHPWVLPFYNVVCVEPDRGRRQLPLAVTTFGIPQMVLGCWGWDPAVTGTAV